MACAAPNPIGGMAAAGGGDPPDDRQKDIKREPSDTPSPSKRHLSRKACDSCRRRRVGCDEGQPCYACVVRGQDCTYDDVERKRGPKGGWTVHRGSIQGLVAACPPLGAVLVAAFTMVRATGDASQGGDGSGTPRTIYQNAIDLDRRLDVGERVQDTLFGRFGQEGFDPESEENRAEIMTPENMHNLGLFLAFVNTVLRPGQPPLQVLPLGSTASQAQDSQHIATTRPPRATRSATRAARASQTAEAPLPALAPRVSQPADDVDAHVAQPQNAEAPQMSQAPPTFPFQVQQGQQMFSFPVTPSPPMPQYFGNFQTFQAHNPQALPFNLDPALSPQNAPNVNTVFGAAGPFPMTLQNPMAPQYGRATLNGLPLISPTEFASIYSNAAGPDAAEEAMDLDNPGIGTSVSTPGNAGFPMFYPVDWMRLLSQAYPWPGDQSRHGGNQDSPGPPGPSAPGISPTEHHRHDAVLTRRLRKRLYAKFCAASLPSTQDLCKILFCLHAGMSRLSTSGSLKIMLT